jgi:hypothetical protein
MIYTLNGEKNKQLRCPVHCHCVAVLNFYKFDGDDFSTKVLRLAPPNVWAVKTQCLNTENAQVIAGQALIEQDLQKTFVGRPNELEKTPPIRYNKTTYEDFP